MSVSTRAIRTSTAQTTCDVCGRTLLRGERAEIYLSGSDRRSVCELCTSRALHGGWVREGEAPAHDESSTRAERRRSLFGRRRPRRAEEGESPLAEPALAFESELRDDPFVVEEPAPAEPPVAPEWPQAPRRPERRLRRRRPAVPAEDAGRTAESPGGREPRHVRAVPTAVEHRIASALELFNGSEHPKTVSGVTRSLGLPDVCAQPADPVASLVRIVVAWELCWYRYEVDLSDELPTVRAAGQGYELSELSEAERQANVSADERGRLFPGA